MAEILKRVEDYKFYTLEEAESFVEKCKADPDKEGYEVKKYQIVKKEKKQKGEVIDFHFVATVTKVWND